MKQTTAQLKRNKLLEKTLNEMFQREAFTLGLKGMVTVTHVQVSSDVRSAKVYFSFLGFKDQSDADICCLITAQNLVIRKLLWSMLRHKLRHLPKLSFFVDETDQEVLRIEKLLAKLKT